MSFIDFLIEDTGPVSKAFLEKEIETFFEAANYVQQLKYGRNKDKINLCSVLTDNCGTCSTKHALLKLLADEQGKTDIKLIMGIYKMSAANTRGVGSILSQYQLDYIPEAHNYLKYGNEILDYTRTGSKAEDFLSDLLEETEIRPNQISNYKISYHKQFLKKWLLDEQINYSEDEIWTIREACIEALGNINS